MRSIRVINFQLGEQAGGWRQEEERSPLPSQSTAEPAVAQNGANHVFALCQQWRYVIGLVENTFCVVREIGG